MNLLVDGRAFCASSAGISTVLRCVLVSWASQFSQNRYYVILPKKKVDSIQEITFPPNIIWVEAKTRIFRHLPNLIYLFLMTPFLIKKYKIDSYYTPVPCLPFFIPKKVKTLVEINDVVNLEFQETMTWTNRLANKLLFNRSIKKADVLWSISEYTQKRVEYYFPKRKCQKIFVGCATDRKLYRRLQLNQKEIVEIKQKQGIKDKFILFVGSLEPRKNLPFLLDIISDIYTQTKTQLVVVGAKGWKNSLIKKKVDSESFIKESTIFCGFISNEELVELYNIADCFVSPSLNEGFGLPQLEAFLCGCPVITAANSAMIEVAEGKDGGYLLEGYKKEDWIETICNVINNKPVVNEYQFEKYDWDRIVIQLENRII